MGRLILLISLQLFFNTSLYPKGLKCFSSSNLRYIKNNKYIYLEKPFCLNHAQYHLISLNCNQNINCDAIKSYRSSVTGSHHPTVGSPYHQKCSNLGGNPRLIEYSDGKSWHEDAICEFFDESFISVFN